jgi:hypothetical protein
MPVRVPERHRRVDEQPRRQQQRENECGRGRPRQHDDPGDQVDDPAEQDEAPSFGVPLGDRPTDLGDPGEEQEHAQHNHQREDGGARPHQCEHPGHERDDPHHEHERPAPPEIDPGDLDGGLGRRGAHRDPLRSRTIVGT